MIWMNSIAIIILAVTCLRLQYQVWDLRNESTGHSIETEWILEYLASDAKEKS